MSNPLDDRRQSLEDEFFRKQNQEQLKKIQSKLELQKNKEELIAASGIDDSELIDKLVDMGITAGTLMAINLVPLFRVAWADGTMDEKEKQAITTAAAKKGIAKDSDAYSLLQSWLQEEPGKPLYDTWKDYLSTLLSELSEYQRNALQSQVLGLAKDVAAAAGGILGIGTISKEEKKALEEIEAAFSV